MRPLFIDELAEVFILDRDRTPPFDEEDRLNVPHRVLSYLPSLVTVVRIGRRWGEREIVILAHFSVKEYLISSRIARGSAKSFSTTETEANLHIAEACLAYHLYLSATILATDEQCNRYTFWLYVIRYWTEHLERVPRLLWTPITIDMALQALTPSSQAFLNIMRMCDSEKNTADRWRLGFSDLSTPLCHIASLRAAQLAKLLLENGALVNELSPGYYGFALAVAARQGSVSVVKALLDNGADINLQGGDYGNALQSVIVSENNAVLQLLLDRGANVNLQGGEFGNAIVAAAAYGEKEAVQLLLDAGAKVNARGTLYGNALYAAIANNEIKCAELLISRGAEVWPPGPELEDELRRIEVIQGKIVAENLRRFQRDPSRYIIAVKVRQKVERR